MITPGELLPQLSALADQDEALAQLRGYWLQSDDRELIGILGALFDPLPSPPVALPFSVRALPCPLREAVSLLPGHLLSTPLLRSTRLHHTPSCVHV